LSHGLVIHKIMKKLYSFMGKFNLTLNPFPKGKGLSAPVLRVRSRLNMVGSYAENTDFSRKIVQ
jgi:hypothetical protein